jgi:hypothetical protein
MRTSTEEVSLDGCYIETVFTMEFGILLALVFSYEDEKIAINAVNDGVFRDDDLDRIRFFHAFPAFH